MTAHPAFKPISRVVPCLLVLCLAVSAGCSSKPKQTYYSSSRAGSSCYAKALPTSGEGGLAWGATLQMARQKSLNNCIRYAGRSGGTPNTCKVVLAECK
ncbi:hypothetical protein [Pseudomonas sp. H9]|uniref:hypothetical protein n=1 Tax=Pseudomonas sp. H9 TaxID=483968 RepID=UPI001057ECA6|nr:hypothetical protein [Pseudomonas sp. H9]TDF82418.1 hypothetical protein E1573_14745 [Pseudomonas sp. H9]